MVPASPGFSEALSPVTSCSIRMLPGPSTCPHFLSGCSLDEQAPASCFLGPSPPQLEQSQEARLQVLPLAPSPTQLLSPGCPGHTGRVGRGCELLLGSQWEGSQALSRASKT